MNTDHDHEEAFSEYKKAFESCRFKAVCQRYVVRVQKLKGWLESESHVVVNGNKVSQFYRLIEYAYRNRTYPKAPISEYTLSKDCTLTFCVLLNLNHGDLIDTFIRHGINDGALKSKNKYELTTALERVVNDIAREKTGSTTAEIPDADDLAGKCDQERWQFVAPAFHLNIDQYWNENIIIPVNWKQKIKKQGGTAQLWQITVLEEFLDQDIQDRIPHCRFTPDPPEDELGPRYQLVLKQFNETYVQAYKNEKAGFNALRDHEGMVQCFGSFVHSYALGQKPSSETKAGSKTSSILLEYGDWDLEDYFFNINPPLRHKEQIDFYTDLFSLAHIVKGVHTQDDDYSKKAYHGWHADIKPSNILVVEGKFKLADLGFMKFIEGTGNEPMAELEGGTWAYGAPENSIVDHVKVTQSVDVWSLGCVFSVAASWVVGGRKAIKIYSQSRSNGIEVLNQREKLHSRRKKGFFFHDGAKVLAEVTAWHDLLRESARRNDQFTIPLLNLIDQKLLLDDPAKRLSMEDLCKELEHILKNSSGHPRPTEIPATIKEAMLKIDEDAPLDPSSSRMQDMSADRWNSKHVNFEGRKARKEATLQTPDMRTSHRSVNLRSELGSTHELQSIPEREKSQIGSEASKNQQDSPYRAGYQTPNSPSNSGPCNLPQHPQQSPRLSSGPSGSFSRPSFSRHRRSEHNAETIQEAYGELILKRSRTWGFLKKNKNPKDAKLSRYFVNRDIKLLVDNGSSMKKHWRDVQKTVETLAVKAHGQSPGGIDLHFTSGSEKLIECRDHIKIREIMKREDAQPADGVSTDINVALWSLLTNHLDYVKRFKRFNQGNLRKLTLLIFTDGVWEGTVDKQAMRRDIESFVRQVIDLLGKFEKRPVSIEFVQFGEDSDATTFLRQLDNDLYWEAGIPDWIDTEHSKGDVYKMLLGSFVDDIDEMDDISGNGDHVQSPTSYSGGVSLPSELASPTTTNTGRG